MFQHILVPIDDTPASKSALMTAAALTDKFGGRITLLYVLDVAREYAAGALSVVPYSDLERRKADIQRLLNDASALVQEFGGVCSVQVAHGMPIHKVINTIATELDVDVIAMMNCHRSGIGRILWGSVTDGVVREARVPVLVVHESKEKTTLGTHAVGAR